MTPIVGKYLGACLYGLKDRNNIVRKYNASAIGHLIGVAKVKRKLTMAVEFFICQINFRNNLLFDFLLSYQSTILKINQTKVFHIQFWLLINVNKIS